MEISNFFSQNEGLDQLPAFATSLAIGLLIGLERERSPAAKAGLRTFALTALLGTLVALLSDRMGSPWLLATGLLAVSAMIVSAYLADNSKEDPGTTTQAALVLCFGLGAIVWYGYTNLAVMLAIVTTLLLHFKPELQNMSKSLSRGDVQSILQFAVLSFVILPILPNQGYGSFGAINPYQIWMMVVLISGVSLAGYIALRMVGQRYGAPLLGIFGGLASSTATTLVYARHGQGGEALGKMAAVVIMMANLVVLVRLAVVSGIVAPRVLPDILPVLAGGFLLGSAAIYFLWRHVGQDGYLPVPQVTNPTEIRISLGFGLLYAIVLFCAAWLSNYAGDSGLYALALVSGLTDVDAISLSSLHLLELGQLNVEQVVTAVTIAYLANLAFKFGMVAMVGGRALARLCLAGVLAMALGVSVALMLRFWI